VIAVVDGAPQGQGQRHPSKPWGCRGKTLTAESRPAPGVRFSAVGNIALTLQWRCG
jgi:hypothetical protein